MINRRWKRSKEGSCGPRANSGRRRCKSEQIVARAWYRAAG